MGKLANNMACCSYFENKNGSYSDLVPIWKTKMAAPVTKFVLENNKDGKLENTKAWTKACSSYFGKKNGSYWDMVPIWKTKMAAPVT